MNVGTLWKTTRRLRQTKRTRRAESGISEAIVSLSAAPLCVSPPLPFRPLSPPHTLSSRIHLPPPPSLRFFAVHLSCV